MIIIILIIIHNDHRNNDDDNRMIIDHDDDRLTELILKNKHDAGMGDTRFWAKFPASAAAAAVAASWGPTSVAP